MGAKAVRRFPEGRVGFAVGDIHGRADLLTRLFERLEQARQHCGENPIVVFLGDYVDRGPDSAEVIDLLQWGRPEGFERRFLKGNHEDAMLRFLKNPLANRLWLAHGGLETVASYGVHPLPSLGAGAAELLKCAAALDEKLPDRDRRFLNSLERYVVLGDYFFVHAGIDPTVSLEHQSDDQLFWIRERFLNDRTVMPLRIVHGHTPIEKPYIDERRVGIDTGAYLTGVLTAARFEGEQVSFIDVRIN
jgi:serine/threonine protein phosphatase 1